MSTGPPSRPYLPAAGHDWALPLYDPIVRLMGLGPTRQRLIEQAHIRPGDRVLEIGCGTGSVVALAKRLYPQAEIVGLDPDPKALAQARAKSARAGLPIQFDQAFSDALPYPDASFDRILSSFMFHHLPKEAKTKTLTEARRVLRPGGSFHLVDFAPSRAGARGFLMRVFHPDEALKDSEEDRMIARLREAGFAQATRVTRQGLVFGFAQIIYYSADV